MVTGSLCSMTRNSSEKKKKQTKSSDKSVAVLSTATHEEMQRFRNSNAVLPYILASFRSLCFSSLPHPFPPSPPSVLLPSFLPFSSFKLIVSQICHSHSMKVTIFKSPCKGFEHVYRWSCDCHHFLIPGCFQ